MDTSTASSIIGTQTQGTEDIQGKDNTQNEFTQEPLNSSLSNLKLDGDLILRQQKSDFDIGPHSSRLGFEFESSDDNNSENKQDEEPLHPYGENYTPLISSIINDNKKKLGIINLFWPFSSTSHLNTYKAYPESYKTNTNKEKVLLLYAENFRKQYQVNFPTKKPLLLAAENECRVQKMVSTTIRPTKLCYPEMHTWQGCAQFVSDHIIYQPLECPHLMPEQVVSGQTVLARQSGHCFEMSLLLASYLIAVGYDAYVVSGYATKDYCQNNLVRTVCPDIPDISEEVEEEEPVVEGKYTVREPRDLRSKFVLMMEKRERDKEEKEMLILEEEERKRIQELEKPPHDPLYWWGIHSWVAILPGKRDVEEVLFLQPGSGVASPPSDPNYLGIESIWNHRNYWVNVQVTSGCGDVQFDLRDTTCWEHLLAGEPWEWQEVARDIELDAREQTLLEKHLDMPASWVQRLHVPHDKYEQRYPIGQKNTFYKKAQVEKFAPYLHEDGLICRVTTFEDYECERPKVEYEMYKNRDDCLYRLIRYIFPEKIITEYDKGREDALMRQTRFVDDSRRVMEFYHKVRYDSLRMLELTPVSMEEHFEQREDRLYYRFVTFDPRTRAVTKWSITDGTIRRTVTKIIEKFHRDEAVVADRDIARREFDISNEEFNLNYHYAEGKITAGTRYFIKPPVTEQGDRLKFDSKLTSGYVVDTTAPPQKKMELFWLLDACLQAEQDSLKHIRDMEDEILSILRSLMIESAEPKLKISIFDEERNSAAKEGMKMREQKLKEDSAKEVEAETDYLAVYMVQIGDKPLSSQNVLEVRNYCLNEYKMLLVDRANKMQLKFDKLTEELQAKHQWYENLGGNVGHEDEEMYMDDVRRLAFQLHTLELRLLRHKDLAPVRYTALDNWLCCDPRLMPFGLKPLQ